MDFELATHCLETKCLCKGLLFLVFEPLVFSLNCLEARKIEATLIATQTTTHALGTTRRIGERNVDVVSFYTIRTRIHFYTIVQDRII